MKTKELILISVSGKDKKGLTFALTSILSDYDAQILDIGQADIHKSINLAILFEIKKGSDTAPVLKDLLMKAYELGIQIDFEPISVDEYNRFTHKKQVPRHIVTLLGKGLSAQQISKATEVIYENGLNIRTINRLSSPQKLDVEYSNFCVQFNIEGKISDKKKFAANLMDVSKEEEIDIAFQEDSVLSGVRRLVCFDMDSTLIQCEVIDELAEKHGCGEKVREITAKAMAGQLDFKSSFIDRIATLEGLKEKTLKEIADNLPLTEGAERLIKALKQYGYKTAIISGGFTYFGQKLKDMLGIDYVFANQLEIKNGRLTGKHIGDIVDGKKKAELLKMLADKEGISTDQVIAVGDGANDLPMLKTAGMGIAFRAKEKVKQKAQHSISKVGLDGILYLLGYNDKNFK